MPWHVKFYQDLRAAEMTQANVDLFVEEFGIDDRLQELFAE